MLEIPTPPERKEAIERRGGPMRIQLEHGWVIETGIEGRIVSIEKSLAPSSIPWNPKSLRVVAGSFSKRSKDADS